MKTLLVLRHAKSSWSDPGRADFDRPLKKRGRNDAPAVGDYLRGQDLVPDVIVTSPALRAVETVALVADGSGYDGEIVLASELYPGDPEDYVDRLRGLDDDCRTAMVVGHNPGLVELVADLTGEVPDLPTAGLARITLPIDRWADLDLATPGTLVAVRRPKEAGAP
jgi:phosphohistidine phosphatase